MSTSVDRAKVLDRLAARLQPEGLCLDAQRGDGGGGEQGETVAPRFVSPGSLEEAMDEDDVTPGQLVSTGDPTADERLVMDEELQVEPWGKTTGVAVATRRLVDVPLEAFPTHPPHRHDLRPPRSRGR